MIRNYACRICGFAEESGNRYEVAEAMFRSGESFVYFECGRCGCLQIAEIPEDMSKYYPSGYYSFGTTSRDKTDNVFVRTVRAMRTRFTVRGGGLTVRLLRRLFPYPKLESLAPLHLSYSTRILDVGCGAGWRLFALREAGFTRLLGADPFLREDIRYGNGLEILRKDVHAIEGEWDVVMFHHSFEHVANPIETLRAVSKLMPPGGICLLRIPTVGSYAWEHYRAHWYQIDAPRHFFLHSAASIRLVADRTGFVVSDIRYDSTGDQFWKSELNVHAGDPTPYHANKRLRKQWNHRARELNRERKGDQAAFYLRKA